MNELAHRDEQSHPVAATPAEQRFMQTIQMVREAMLNPDVDANKAKVMAELMTGLEDRSMQADFNRDLNAAIMDMPVITKAGIITIPAKDGKPERTQGRFARFEDIDRVVRPILERHNLAIRFDVDESNKGVSIRPILMHRNGHTERGGTMHLPLDTSGAKNNVQGAGSAVSYGKRYTMCAMLNIITEGTDDDGSLGRYAIDMPHEREVAVLEGAEAAAQAGNYQEWFDGQGVKDRAWMVNSGHHLRLGGEATALPGLKPPVQERRDPPPTERREPDSKHDTSTPEGWTAQYEDDCRAARDIDDLQKVYAKASKGLARLQGDHPKLFDRATEARATAQERLMGGA